MKNASLSMKNDDVSVNISIMIVVFLNSWLYIRISGGVGVYLLMTSETNEVRWPEESYSNRRKETVRA